MTPLEKARAKYDEKRPRVSFRLTPDEAEQIKIIQQAKESLSQAVARVFREKMREQK